jgi:hypothetical protein
MSSHDKTLSELATAAMHVRRDPSQAAQSVAGDVLDPRIVTRGSFSRKSMKPKAKSERAASTCPDLSDLLEEFFFDWLQVTLPNAEGRSSCAVGGREEEAAVDAAFQWARKHGLHPGRIRGGHNGYRAALPFSEAPESLDTVFQVNAGSSGGLMPNLMLTGGHGACARLAPSLQEAFPGARLSRADAALDWSQEGLWDDLLRMARLLSSGNRKLGGVRTIESDTGRTFYLGSRTSTVSLRVYEKDRERAAKGVIDAADIDPDLIRIEWTFRPQSKSKVGMAALDPGQMIRSSVWARDFMARAANIMRVTGRVERLHRQEVAREVREKTLQGTVDHGVKQYARSFTRLAAARIVEREHGGHYDTAMVEPHQIEAEAVAIFTELLSETGMAVAAMIEERLDEVMDPDQWRTSYVHELMDAPDAMEASAMRAQADMARLAARSGLQVTA